MPNKKIQGITIELNADTAGILDGLKDIDKELSKTTKSLRDVDKLLKMDPDNVILMGQKQEYLAKAIEETKKQLEEEQRVLENLKSSDNADKTVEQQKALERAIEATKKKLEGYENQLDQTETELDEVGKETQDASNKTSVFGDVLKANLTSDAIISGVKALANGIKEVAKASLDVGMQFESSMSQVAATMGMTTEEIRGGSEAYKKLENAAKQMGETTMFSASEAADALNYLALAGYDADKAVETLPKVLTLAASGGMELATASDMITDAMSALGMSVEDVDKYVDEMAKTAQKSNTSVQQLGEATLVAAGAASLTGQSLETMNAALGVLANNGIKSAEGGTKLRNVLLSLSAPTDKAKAALEQLGVQISDSNGDMRDLQDIMDDLATSLEGLGDAEKTATLKEIFNKADIGAVNALLKSTTGEFQDLKTEIENSAGAAKNMADTMQDNLQGKLTILKSSLEGLGISVSQVFGSTFAKTLDGATKAVGRLQDSVKNGSMGVSLRKLDDALNKLLDKVIDWLEDALPDIIDGIATIVDHADDIIAVIKGIVAGFVTLKTATITVNGISSAMKIYASVTKDAEIAQKALNVAADANPYVLLATAIVGVGVALGNLIGDFAEAEPKYKELDEEVKKLKEDSEALMNTMSDSRNNYQEDTKRLDYYQKLRDELTQLNSKEQLNVGQKERLKAIVNELNGAFEGLNLEINNETGKLKDDTDAWLKNIDARIAAAKSESAMKRIQELTDEMAESDYQRWKVVEELSIAERKLREEQSRLNAAMDGSSTEEYSFQLGRYRDNVDELTGYVEDLRNQQKGWDEQTQNNETEIQNLTEYVHHLTSAVTDNANSIEEANQKISDSSEGINTVAGYCELAEKSYQELKDKAHDAVESQRNDFEHLKEQAKASVDEIATSFQKQAEGIKRYAQDIAEAEAIMQADPDARGLLEYYINQGPEAAAELEALVQAFRDGGKGLEEFYEAVEAFNETESLIEGMSELNVAIETGYVEAVETALAGLEENLPQIETAYLNNFQAVETDADEHRTKMNETTIGSLDDMVTAVNEKSLELQEATKKMMLDSYKEARIAIGLPPEETGNDKAQKYWELGEKIDESIAQGIEDNADLIARSLQAALDDAAKNVNMSALTAKINAALGEAMGKKGGK